MSNESQLFVAATAVFDTLYCQRSRWLRTSHTDNQLFEQSPGNSFEDVLTHNPNLKLTKQPSSFQLGSGRNTRKNA
jgi:hypothetical protein